MLTPDHLATRANRIQHTRTTLFDVAVIGGGIHGMAVARIARQAGLSVALLEQRDYAHATSSRSSKMAHGGLRYLEMWDFRQVFEGIKAREDLFEKSPNLVVPERFLIPIARGDFFFRWKLAAGLFLYDLMVRNRARRHRWIPRRDLHYPGFDSTRIDLQGCFQYTDGLMNDARLVFELLCAAQHDGACCLNYAQVTAIRRSADSIMELDWLDLCTRQSQMLRARTVVNCAGPWASEVGDRYGDAVRLPLKFSRGSHLLFSVPWRAPSLFLPLAEKGRYYFVWPHPTGTLVGTTEREVSDLEIDPLPTRDEVDEILERLQRDLPQAGLTREKLHYAFAGIRALPLRNSKKGVSQLSRKHIWAVRDGMVTLLGGKYTTFAWTAAEGVRAVLRCLGRSTASLPDPLRELPSALSEREQRELCQQLTARFTKVDEGVSRAVKRLGRMVCRYIDRPEAWQEVIQGVLKLELLHAVEMEHAETVEDIIRRRLELEFSPSHGKEIVSHVKAALAANYTSTELDVQEREWLDHLAQVENLLASARP